MTRTDDEFGKRILTPLRTAPPIEPQVAAEEKTRYLLQAENLRKGILPDTGREDKHKEHGRLTGFLRKRPLPLLRGLAALLVALIFLVGSSLTVFAAQDSLPGEALYPLKSLSEDVHLSLTHSPQGKLEMTLGYTNRRMDEISHLLATGKPVPALASERFQGELESTLQLAAQMEDKQMQNALSEIKGHAESQGMTIDELITRLPEQAGPAIMHLQDRLREQVTLSAIGENDPQTYRLEVRERQRRHSGIHNPTPANNGSASTPAGGSSTPLPTEAGEEHDNGSGHPTQAPGHDNGGPGQGNPDPGNGNHGPDASHTPKP